MATKTLKIGQGAATDASAGLAIPNAQEQTLWNLGPGKCYLATAAADPGDAFAGVPVKPEKSVVVEVPAGEKLWARAYISDAWLAV